MNVLQNLIQEQREIFDVEEICFEDMELLEMLKTTVGRVLTSVHGQMKNAVCILFGCWRCIINYAVGVKVPRKA